MNRFSYFTLVLTTVTVVASSEVHPEARFQTFPLYQPLPLINETSASSPTGTGMSKPRPPVGVPAAASAPGPYSFVVPNRPLNLNDPLPLPGDNKPTGMAKPRPTAGRPMNPGAPAGAPPPSAPAAYPNPFQNSPSPSPSAYPNPFQNAPAPAQPSAPSTAPQSEEVDTVRPLEESFGNFFNNLFFGPDSHIEIIIPFPTALSLAFQPGAQLNIMPFGYTFGYLLRAMFMFMMPIPV